MIPLNLNDIAILHILGVEKRNLIANPSTIKHFGKPKYDLTMIRLQTFILEKYLQVFSKNVNTLKKMIRYITDDSDILQMNLMNNKLKLSIMMGSFFKKSSFICVKTIFKAKI